MSIGTRAVEFAAPEPDGHFPTFFFVAHSIEMGLPWTSARGLALALAIFALGVCADGQGNDQQALARRLEDLERRLDQEPPVWLDYLPEPASQEERAERAAGFPMDQYLDELAQVAHQAAGTEVAQRAWTNVERLRGLFGHSVFDRSLWRVARRDLAGGFLLELARGAPDWGPATAERMLREVLASEVAPAVTHQARAQLALLLIQFPGGGPRSDEARALLALVDQGGGEEAAAEIGGLPAKSFTAWVRFELERMQPGQLVPEFYLADESGAPVRLSDLRGRVVLVDLWSFVLGADPARLADEERVLARLARQPFTFLRRTAPAAGVHLERGGACEHPAAKPTAIRSTRERVHATEPRKEPAPAGWAARAFPELYLLDAHGVIRARWSDVPTADEIERGIATLLLECRPSSAGPALPPSSPRRVSTPGS